jgi:hypothetical protein
MSTPEHPPHETSPAPAAPAPCCACNKEAFMVLPPELKPRAKAWQTGLRKVICPDCELVFWTSNDSDYCVACRLESNI